MTTLQDLKALNLDAADVTLWAVKGPSGPAANSPRFSGKWVSTTDGVDTVLKATLAAELAKVEELLDYSLLAQNNEASALQISIDETHFAILAEEIAAELVGKKATESKHLLNSAFYVAKLVIGDKVVWAAKRTEPGWKTKNAFAVKNLFFSEQQLAIDDRPHFELGKTFDFIAFDGSILVRNKGAFESILRYKSTQRDDFTDLQSEPEFQAVFVSIAPFVEYVGDNKIQLRRACAIKTKGHYRDPDFMLRLRDNQADYGFNIHFDNDGKIIASEETCPQIMKALLDHRLKSGFSTLVYDVQDTTTVAL